MKFSRLLLTSSFLAGTVFAIATFPITTVQSESFEVRLQDKSLFSSDLQRLAVPYLWGVGLISVGAGFTALTLGGWCKASRELNRSKDTLEKLKREQSETNDLLEKMRFSKKHLNKVGLDAFLDDSSSLIGIETGDFKPVNDLSHNAPKPVSTEVTTSKITTAQSVDNAQVIEHLISSAIEAENDEQPTKGSPPSPQLDRLLQELKQITAQLENSQSIV